jgi:hypothetical protein
MGRTHGMHEGNRSIFNILLYNLKERDHLGDLSMDGRIILFWSLKKFIMRLWAL